MPKAIPISTTSRRAMLGASSAALLAGAAGFVLPPPLPWRGGPRPVPVPGDDAKVAQLLSQLRRDHAAVLGVEEEGHYLPEGITPQSKDQERRLTEAMDVREDTAEALAEAMTAARADTVQELQAKAAAVIQALAIYLPLADNVTVEELAAGEGEPHDRMALSLAYDILAWRTA